MKTITILILLIAATEAKLRLVPKGKKNQKKKAAVVPPKKKKLQQQIILQPLELTNQESKLILEASIIKNEAGQHVLSLSQESAESVQAALTAASSSSSSVVDTPMQTAQAVEEPAKQEAQVLFYKPSEMKSTAGEIPVPTKVYDENGQEVDVAGKEALVVPPPPPPKDLKKPKQVNVEASSDNQTRQTKSTTNTQQQTQQQDQLIIISTVATMALFVGAISARRLRSKQFLSFCIENDVEDELAYDAAFTTKVKLGGGYDTFAGKYGGDLRWRGDLEKFDV